MSAISLQGGTSIWQEHETTHSGSMLRLKVGRCQNAPPALSSPRSYIVVWPCGTSCLFTGWHVYRNPLNRKAVAWHRMRMHCFSTSSACGPLFWGHWQTYLWILYCIKWDPPEHLVEWYRLLAWFWSDPEASCQQANTFFFRQVT